MKKLVIVLLATLLLLPAFTACRSETPYTLPHSMKGYELYSWQMDEEWHFTLITGTNRNKTVDEIVTGDDFVRSDGWVVLHAIGEQGVEVLFDRVPAGEFVFWNAGHIVNPDNQVSMTFTYPPDDMVNNIKSYADKLGIDFNVPAH
jgi:hypothetical protein